VCKGLICVVIGYEKNNVMFGMGIFVTLKQGLTPVPKFKTGISFVYQYVVHLACYSDSFVLFTVIMLFNAM
jgi:hypothetical protein